jgi:UTP--glucose-1-phosphate uridylyltransferase
MTIKKAVFVVAGFGTRFLPATKAQPKEMLPIVDKPIIQYLVEEAVEAGIQEIIFVTGRGKNSIENHFDRSVELEYALQEKGKLDKLHEINRINELADFAYVRQPVQKGDGHALLCAKPFLDPQESVLVIYPDYLMPAKNQSIKKIIEIYNKHNAPVICGDIVPDSEVGKYGVIDFNSTSEEGVVEVKGFVEKPEIGKAPSNLISAGYFVVTPELLGILEKSKPTTKDGELRLADAFVQFTLDKKPLYAYKPKLPGYDCGNILGFLKATVDFGLQKEELSNEFLEFLNDAVKKHKHD